jgi:tetratricopeptide (TPR) repeat protein
MDRHQRALIILFIGLVLAAVAYIIIDGLKDGAEKQAGAALVAATDLASYQATAKQHPDTLAGGSAMIISAQLQWDDGQQEASVKTLNDFLTRYPDHPGRPSAMASLGTRLIRLDRSEEAAGNFRKILEDPKAQYLAPLALISLGDIDWKAGKIEEAEASYKRVATDYSESPFAYSANRRMSLLRAEQPVAIDARPVPAPEPGGINQQTMEELLRSGAFSSQGLQGGTIPGFIPTPAPEGTPAPAPVVDPAAPTAPPAPAPAEGQGAPGQP